MVAIESKMCHINGCVELGLVVHSSAVSQGSEHSISHMGLRVGGRKSARSLTRYYQPCSRPALIGSQAVKSGQDSKDGGR